jgi:hypothetical protein
MVPRFSVTPPRVASAALLTAPVEVTKNLILPLLGRYIYEFDRATPPTVFKDESALLIVPFDRATPPIEFDTPAGVEIAPVARMVVSPLESSAPDSVHPPIVFDVPVALEILPPLN